MRLLVIEDEEALADALCEILRQNSYMADSVSNGLEGLDYARSGIYDMILLDIMLPGMDGISILKALRREQIFTPVILLTAKTELQDIVTGLDAGSDDYLAKPFSTTELLARIRALTRRGSNYTGEIITHADISLNKGTMELSCGKNSIKLGAKEFQLMEIFLTSPKQVIPKDLLIEKVWGFDTDAEYNNVEVYVSFLRQKLHSLGTAVQIKTSRGIGYYLEVAP
ncbi:DNA-binding response OmpR family regulator [Kineothrix alysoides]|uniref:Stage 0 sporulation protein A homolog n=1 Tax=Kineothrix alysoides TaxID=1469948 RepID=A0A4R1R5Y3_9FIRM|nr:response regulator transcription factor [Kineothrix alysoides]TCL60951.1 DNA-binding response OmpR family regulator [Kineothrix alysoides]